MHFNVLSPRITEVNHLSFIIYRIAAFSKTTETVINANLTTC